ncbi:hypothetical protein M0804_013602 [Polistes exclamans]|nr:hypothetical protein M0804_013602 [Polistes exclamans]
MGSDKGKNTVIMKKEEYLNEMQKMLQNKDIYQLLNKDPTSRFKKLANNLIMKLRKESIITGEIEKNMKSYNSVALKIYGLRKIHKQSLALRPVVSCIRLPCYKLPQFLHPKLSSAMTNKFVYSVKNSFEFVEFIQKIPLSEDYRLVSIYFGFTCELSNIILTAKTRITPKSCNDLIDAIDSEAVRSVDYKDWAQFVQEDMLFIRQGKTQEETLKKQEELSKRELQLEYRERRLALKEDQIKKSLGDDISGFRGLKRSDPPVDSSVPLHFTPSS